MEKEQINVGALVIFTFSTNFGTGARNDFDDPISVADFKIYKDDIDVPRSSNSGVSLTTQLDSKLGVYKVKIDLTDNTDAGFYSEFSKYSVVLYPNELLDGVLISKEIHSFKIETDVSGYVNNFIYFDKAAPTTGTQEGVNGTQKKPVNAEADAITLSSLTGKRIHVTGQFDLPSTLADYYFEGEVAIGTINLAASFLLSTSTVKSLKMIGNGSETSKFIDCKIAWDNTTTGQAGTYENCLVGGVFNFNANASSPRYINCYSEKGDIPVMGLEDGEMELYNFVGTFIINLLDNAFPVIHSNGATKVIADGVLLSGNITLIGIGNFVNTMGADVTDAEWEEIGGTDSSKSALYQGAVWFDGDLANTNSVFGTDGLPTNKVSGEAAALILLPQVGTNLVIVKNTFVVPSAIPRAGEFRGVDLHSVIDLNGFNAHDNVFSGLIVTGSMASVDDETIHVNCILQDYLNMGGASRNCIYEGVCSIGNLSGDEKHYIDYLGSSRDPLILTMSGANRKAIFVGWTGNMTIDIMDDATGDLLVILNGGSLTLDAGCTLGDVKVGGFGTFINNANGTTVDVSQYIQKQDGSGNLQYTAKALELAPTDSLTQQQIRDSLKLAPTAGGGAAKSIDAAIVDPIPEPAAGLPPVTPTFLQIKQWFWATWRNQATETNTEQKIRNDAGTELAKRPAQNDDGITFTNSKWEAP